MSHQRHDALQAHDGAPLCAAAAGDAAARDHARRTLRDDKHAAVRYAGGVPPYNTLSVLYVICMQ